MKKFLLTLVTVFVLVSLVSVDSADARKKGGKAAAWNHQICVDAGAQIPDDDDGLETGYGLAFTYYYRLSNSFFFSASLGYQSFGFEDIQGYDLSDLSLTIMPVTLGIRYNFTTSGLQPYIGAEAGFFLVDISGRDADVDSETEFGIIPKVGIRYPLSPGLDLDVNLKYNVIMPEDSDENMTYVGINIGVADTIQR
jgi:opacity protein-like surface antigen